MLFSWELFSFYSYYPSNGLLLSICLNNASSITCTVEKRKKKNIFNFSLGTFFVLLGLTKTLYKTNVGSSFKWNIIPTIHFINQFIKLFCLHWSTWFQFISDIRTPLLEKKEVVVATGNQKETIPFYLNIHFKWS